MSMVGRGDNNSGFTLVELLVVLVLLGVIGSVTTTAVVSTLRSSSNTSSRIAALNELENALQRITRDLRVAEPLRLSNDGAAPLFKAFETDLGATIFRDGAESDVRYRLIVDPATGSQQLIRQDTGQTLVTLVDNGGEAVFSYLGTDSLPLDCSTDPTVVSVDDCEELLGGAEQVRITLVRGLGDGRNPVRAETTISVRSMRYRG